MKPGLKERAFLFQQLAALEDSGVPLIQALESLQQENNPALVKPVSRFVDGLRQGRTVAAAGRDSGLLGETDALIIAAQSKPASCTRHYASWPWISKNDSNYGNGCGRVC